MFKNKLANHESYVKTFDGYDLESSLTCYEVFVEVFRDKEGQPIKNRDGSDRLRPVDDATISVLDAEKKVKVIRDGFYKDLFEVNGEYVEKADRNDGSHVYYVVNEDRITVLPAGTKVIAKNGTYRTPKEVGFVLVDDRDIENPRIVRVGKFKTEDHEAEAKELVNRKKKPEVQE